MHVRRRVPIEGLSLPAAPPFLLIRVRGPLDDELISRLPAGRANARNNTGSRPRRSGCIPRLIAAHAISHMRMP